MVATGGLRAREQLQPIDALHPVLGRHAAQEALGEVDRCRRVAPVESQRGATEQGQLAPQRPQRLGIEPVEQCLRLLDPSLTSPQLGQTGDPLGRHSRECRRQFAGRRLQFSLGLGPRASPDQHARIVSPAVREHEPVRPAVGQPDRPVAPLRRAVVVADALAGADQIAAGRDDGVRVGHLAARPPPPWPRPGGASPPQYCPHRPWRSRGTPEPASPGRSRPATRPSARASAPSRRAVAVSWRKMTAT